jgi:hypothetical protein
MHRARGPLATLMDMNPLMLVIGIFCFAALAVTSSPLFWWLCCAMAVGLVIKFISDFSL